MKLKHVEVDILFQIKRKLVVLIVSLGLLPGLAASQEIPTENWIAHTVRDEYLNDYAIEIVSISGTPIMEIPLDTENPEDYITRCDAPPKWSPDGTRLAFVRQLTPEAAERRDESLDVRELIVLDVQTGDRQIVTDSLYRTYDWSPDGQQIVHDTDIDYQQPGENPESSGLVIVNLGGAGSASQIIEPIDNNPLWQPDWSPDGEHIGFYAAQGLEGLGQFYLAEADGSNVVAWEDATVGAFDWSPDGERIVFDDVLYQAESSRMFIAQIGEDNTPQDVTQIAADLSPTQPQWSPDGEHIAFFNIVTDLESALWVLDVDTSEAMQIAAENVSTYDWSPDSTRLVASTDRGIEILHPFSDEAAQVIADGGCPAWRPDETEINQERNN